VESQIRERTQLVHANLVHVRLDLPFEQARKDLTEQVLPRVKQAPGLVAAYWFHPSENLGYSVQVFESEQDARTAAQMVQPGSHPSDGVTVESVETVEVVASL
jgi:uncharacterized protein YmfQ (DUF2313 family)